MAVEIASSSGDPLFSCSRQASDGQFLFFPLSSSLLASPASFVVAFLSFLLRALLQYPLFYFSQYPTEDALVSVQNLLQFLSSAQYSATVIQHHLDFLSTCIATEYLLPSVVDAQPGSGHFHSLPPFCTCLCSALISSTRSYYRLDIDEI